MRYPYIRELPFTNQGVDQDTKILHEGLGDGSCQQNRAGFTGDGMQDGRQARSDQTGDLL